MQDAGDMMEVEEAAPPKAAGVKAAPVLSKDLLRTYYGALRVSRVTVYEFRAL